MPFRIPNTPDTSYSDQAEPDAGDFAALGERNSGVISGCAVAAQGAPALAVDVASGTAVVSGAPLTVTAATLAVQGGEANPRFDLIVVNAAGAVVVLKGTAGTNPVFPSLDPTAYCLLAAVYVRQSTATIVATDIVDKRVSVAATFRRAYTDTTTEAIALTDSDSKTLKILSSGKMSWMSSVLQRLSDVSMEWATSLVLKTADVAQPYILAIKARASSPDTQNALEVQTSAGSTLASINGVGQLFADNFKSGTGTPEGVVTGGRGDIYIDRSSVSADTMLWLKTTTSGNTGWASLGAASSTGKATGVLFQYIGNPATPPAGSLVCDGGLYSATDPLYTDLYTMIGTAYGGTAGVNWATPNFQGMVLIGAGGAAGLGLGEVGGSLTKTLSLENLPVHTHDVNDTGHVHPLGGYPYVWKRASEPTAIRPLPVGQLTQELLQVPPSVPYMAVWPADFDSSAETGISLGTTGAGEEFDALPPVAAVHICVWL